ncbi:MAG TPA: hypothetical protein VMU47_01680 [Caldimonas sp.]|nr:hypothetical protein [Caldimonas sp.]
MNAKQLCVVSIAVAATFAAVAPIASATCDRTPVREARSTAVVHTVALGIHAGGAAATSGSQHGAPHAGLSWWRRWY